MLSCFGIVVHKSERSVHIRNRIFERRIGNFCAFDVFRAENLVYVYALGVDFDKQILFNKLFDGVIGREQEIVVGMVFFDCGHYFLHRVESGRSNYFHRFTGLFFIPILECVENFAVDILAGNIHFKLLGAVVIRACGKRPHGHRHNESKQKGYKFFHGKNPP